MKSLKDKKRIYDEYFGVVCYEDEVNGVGTKDRRQKIEQKWRFSQTHDDKVL